RPAARAARLRGPSRPGGCSVRSGCAARAFRGATGPRRISCPADTAIPIASQAGPRPRCRPRPRRSGAARAHAAWERHAMAEAIDYFLILNMLNRYSDAVDRGDFERVGRMFREADVYFPGEEKPSIRRGT